MEYAELYLDLSSAGIRGNAEGADFEGQIDLNSWSWGMQLTSANVTAPNTPVKMQGNLLKFTKHLDAASTAMLRKLEDSTKLEGGAQGADATLTMVHRGDAGLTLTLAFTGLVLRSCNLDADSDDSSVEVTEVWQAQYDKVKFTYTPRQSSEQRVAGRGTSTGTALTFELPVKRWAPDVGAAATKAADKGLTEEKIDKLLSLLEKQGKSLT